MTYQTFPADLKLDSSSHSGSNLFNVGFFGAFHPTPISAPRLNRDPYEAMPHLSRVHGLRDAV